MVRQECIDVLLIWPGERLHTLAAKKVCRNVASLLEYATEFDPHETWANFRARMISYRSNLLAIRDEVREDDAPQSASVGSVFGELQREFRDGHARHCQTMFCLELMTDSEYEARAADDTSDILARAEFLSVPHEERGEPLHVFAVVGGFQLEKGEIPSWLYDPAKAAWEAFEPLSRKAGAHVPAALRQAMPVQPVDAPGIWYALLYWTMRHEQGGLASKPNERRLLSFSPFLDSADVIELCSLSTDNPIVPAALRDPGTLSEAPDGQVTIEQLACLAAVTPKTLFNVISKVRRTDPFPEPMVQQSGSVPAKYAYAVVRPWLVRHLPRRANSFPESFREAAARLG